MKSRLPAAHPMGRCPIARTVHQILLGLAALLSGLLLPFTSRADPFHVNLITRIDIDANGTPDFEYRGGQAVNSAGCQSWPGFTVTGYGLFGLNGNQVLRSGTGCYPLMASPAAGTTVDPSPVPPLHWGPMAELLVNDFSGIAGSYFFGPFHSSTQGYAAVRFASPAGLHYGWIRFTNAAPDLPPAVAEFSFNPTVSTPLETGRVIRGQGVFSTNEIRIPGSTTVLGRVRHVSGRVKVYHLGSHQSVPPRGGFGLRDLEGEDQGWCLQSGGVGGRIGLCRSATRAPDGPGSAQATRSRPL